MNRRWILWLALAGAVALNLLGGAPPDGGLVVMPAARQPDVGRFEPAVAEVREAAAAHGLTPGLPALVPRDALYPRRAAERGSRDLLSSRDWIDRPAPQPSVPAPADTPAEPAMPYAFAGKKQEAGAVEVFLTRGDHAFVAKVGDVLEGEYRVDSLSPTELILVHIASGKSQSLRIGEAE